MSLLYTTYVLVHVPRSLREDAAQGSKDPTAVSRGVAETVLFHYLSGMVLYCYVMCVTVRAGGIPDGQGWEFTDLADPAAHRAPLAETKTSGSVRHCKWCLKYKPDRSHHCRVCCICVLRMDHHCAWVNNCIGFRNHKYFFLLVAYATADLAFLVATMLETVWWSTRLDVHVGLMVLLLCVEAFATFLLSVVGSFLVFHVWLMLKAMTTVEFCEKSLKMSGFNSSAYSRGAYGNISSVLGPRPLLWLLPCSFPQGDGISWQEGERPPRRLSSRGSRRDSRRLSRQEERPDDAASG